MTATPLPVPGASPLVVGLDVGTTKIACLVGTTDEQGRVEVRGFGIAPSAGLRKGVVVDVDATVKGIREAREKAQESAAINLTGAHVYVGVTGDHTESADWHGAVDITRADQEILPADVDRVRAAAANRVQSTDRDIILERPREFIVDGRRGIADPVHLKGRRLEVVLHVVTGRRRFLDDVRRCVERADLPVDSLVLEALATGEAVTTPEERELGVAVLDLGGGTTDMAVYLDGTLAHTAAIPVGGAHVTYDLSYGLEAPFPAAEQLKLAEACALAELSDPEQVVSYRNVRGETTEAEHVLLAEIAGPRMEELFELVRDALTEVGIDLNQLAAGVVLTGGASRLRGTLDVARQVLQVLVRAGQPLDVVGFADRLQAPEFSTGIGLIRWGADDQRRRESQAEQQSWVGRLRSAWRGFLRLFD